MEVAMFQTYPSYSLYLGLRACLVDHNSNDSCHPFSII